ncbi:MAG: sigma 54-interacting transcriptional regulator [Clostridiales bacterium]|nr:sigma 54-interacting transcriptional regulator [Clostridiales bacterium]
MIRLQIIVPYPELLEKACTILTYPKYKNTLSANVQLVTVDKAHLIQTTDSDIVIARGYTAQYLSRHQKVPTLPIPITGYDILRAIAECKKKYHPSRIGCVGQTQDFQAITGIEELLDIPVLPILSDHFEDLRSCIEEAVRQGCDAIVGGYSAMLAANEMGLSATFIRTGNEALFQVFDEAIHIIEITRARQLKNEMYRTVIKSSQEGILYVDAEGRIILDNPSSLLLTKEPRLKSRLLSEVLPYMVSSCQKVLATGQEIIGEIHRTHVRTISVNYTPILVNKQTNGCLIFFQDITRIQQLEATIRKSLNEKGLRARYHFSDVIYASTIMDMTVEKASSYAATSANIMLLGESGTGKELFAQSIHNQSSRKDGPFVAINCAALPENLLESELFGYVQGAFTGTNKGGKTGLFELAHGGTLFLDEISEISVNMQSKLLRVLQEREVRRIGDDRVISIDVRVISATNRNLKRLVSEGKFRQDLLYRLDVLRIFLPPLRRRDSDTLLLFQHLLNRFSSAGAEQMPPLTAEAQQMLLSHPFYGNVRELGNVAERIRVMHTDSSPITAAEITSALTPEDVDMELDHDGDTHLLYYPAKDSEYQRIMLALRHCGGNQSKAAKELGIDRSTLWRKLKKYQA